MLAVTNKIFHSNFLKLFGTLLNSNRDFSEITSANGTVYVAEAVITTAFFVFVEVLMVLFKKHCKDQLNYENFFRFYEKYFEKTERKLLNDEEFDVIEAAFPELSEKMQEHEIARILDRNLVELCNKMNISSKDDQTGRKLKHEALVKKVFHFQDNPHLQNCKTRSLLKSIESQEERENREFSNLTLSDLQQIGTRLNVIPGGTKIELWQKIKVGLFAESLSINKFTTKTLQIYAFVKNFASNCVFYMRAIRTNNFQLRFAILKSSLKMFKAGKADYFDLVAKHLFDYHNFFPPAFKQFMQEAWVIQSKTKNTFKALDENLENLNLELKNSIKRTKIPVIKQTSRLISVQNETHSIFKTFFGDHAMNFGKSKNMKQDNVKVLKERVEKQNWILWNIGSICDLCVSFSDDEKKEETKKRIEDLDREFVLIGK